MKMIYFRSILGTQLKIDGILTKILNELYIIMNIIYSHIVNLFLFALYLDHQIGDIIGIILLLMIDLIVLS